MSPKQKFTKEDILNTAFKLVREQGLENLNARNIAKMLNSSTQPVFSYYENMADLKADLFAMVSRFHAGYLNKIETDKNLFFNIGMAYIDFALEEPNLFKMLFMSQGFKGKKLTEFFHGDCDGCCENLEKAIAKKYNNDSPESLRLFTDIWLYAHGIASMLAANQLPTPRSEIESMLNNVYGLLLKQAEERT